MKKLLLLCCLCYFIAGAAAQNENNKALFGFTITDYIVTANDSTVIVQVELPQNSKVVIQKDAASIIKHNYTNSKNTNAAGRDTASVAWGKCQLIKSNYYYFSAHLYNKAILPQKNDLLYTFVNYPAAFKGRVYNLVRQAIYFTHVTEESFYDFDSPALLDEKKENSLIDSLVADIKYTAKEMLKLNDGQDQAITSGIFSGQKVFAAMQVSTAANVKDFLDYVIVRPGNYAGNQWKISETYATWMVSGTPMAVK